MTRARNPDKLRLDEKKFNFRAKTFKISLKFFFVNFVQKFHRKINFSGLSQFVARNYHSAEHAQKEAKNGSVICEPA